MSVRDSTELWVRDPGQTYRFQSSEGEVVGLTWFRLMTVLGGLHRRRELAHVISPFRIQQIAKTAFPSGFRSNYRSALDQEWPLILQFTLIHVSKLGEQIGQWSY